VLEIEVKIKVENLESLRQNLLSLGARLERERFSEDNTLYDFHSRSLYQKRCALRLRLVGKKAFLTFKGTPQKSRSFKVREEFETEIRDEKQIKKILRALGFVPVFSYQKHRTLFRTSRLKICLDETAAGNFCEFEGERSDIIKFVKKLGSSRADLIKLDYVQLLQRTGKKA
jgi:predicted adenylyl cyclase CyaB